MAYYKVPQDVEADDKLIGPFSFRQFVYLIIVALSLAAAWGLSRLFIGLAIIPMPVVLLFGALALPLRKDQPMEVYLAAIISFAIKPHNRMWDPDGIESLIEITVPKVVEIQRTKNLTQSEAQQRFNYLAEIVDSQGWAVRGAGVQAPNSPMNSDVYFAAQQTEDVLDDDNSVSQSLDYMIEKSDEKRHQDMLDRMRNPVPSVPTPPVPAAPQYDVPQAPNPYSTFPQQLDTTPQTITAPQAPQTQITPANPFLSGNIPAPTYNPYPDIQQSVIQPLGQNRNAEVPDQKTVPEPVETPPKTDEAITSEKKLSPDIINLASNTELSIETIAREANRIHAKEEASDEVVISLR